MSSPHVNRLMGGSHGGEKKTSHHASRVMGKHAMGGMIGDSPMADPMASTMAPNMPRYAKEGGEMLKRGGKARRRRAEGGELPYEGSEGIGKSPIERRKGGRACHAEGDTVEKEKEEKLRRGGRAKKHSKHRQHHFLGQLVSALGGMMPFKEGGSTDMDEMEEKKKRGGRCRRKKHADGGDIMSSLISQAGPMLMHALPHLLPMLGLKKGGSASHGRRRRHAEGDEVEETRLKRAMGGPGKMRKGVMTKDGMPR